MSDLQSHEDWTRVYKEWTPLGMMHAVHYLKTIPWVKDPWTTAEDVVQNAWEAMWRRKKCPGKNYFLVTVLGYASNAARSAQACRLARTEGKRRTTNVYPVQIFGVALAEVTMTEDVNGPACGDE